MIAGGIRFWSGVGNGGLLPVRAGMPLNRLSIYRCATVNPTPPYKFALLDSHFATTFTVESSKRCYWCQSFYRIGPHFARLLLFLTIMIGYLIRTCLQVSPGIDRNMSSLCWISLLSQLFSPLRNTNTSGIYRGKRNL
jgi:hypothetical protein